MDEITVSAVVQADRKLILTLPDDAPTGPVSVTIKPVEAGAAPGSSHREAIRARLLAAGFLVAHIGVPEDVDLLSPEEIQALGTLPEGARPSEELIGEDRGAY